MAYGPVNLNLGTSQQAGATHTGSRTIYKWPNGTWNATPPPTKPAAAAGAPAAPAAPAPTTTPATAPVGGVNAQNMSDWASMAGQTAAGLADPFAEQRPQYQQQLSKLMSDPGSLATSPLYKFALDQGLEAVNRTAGAKGLLGSGNRLTDLTKFGTGLAGENFFKMAPILSRLAGADTSSPAAAGTAYAYGQGKAMDAFSNQEMERAYRDALAGGSGGGGNFSTSTPTINYPTTPLAAPLATDPYRSQYNQTSGGSMPPLAPSTVYPSAQEYSLYGGSSGGTPSYDGGAVDMGEGYGGGTLDQLGFPGYAPGAGGAVDMGAGYGPGTLEQLGLDYNPPVEAGGAMDMGAGMGYDPWNPFGQAIPTLSKINATLPPPDPNQQDLWGDWGMLGTRG